ncbi:unnamed protein product [marine sediment metagenome]|uniref:Uncharacterized protein n=1 Tax=marine sediment metagenome TaxID=412755 RepID=X1MQD8_9ZZZZ
MLPDTLIMCPRIMALAQELLQEALLGYQLATLFMSEPMPIILLGIAMAGR